MKPASLFRYSKVILPKVTFEDSQPETALKFLESELTRLSPVDKNIGLSYKGVGSKKVHLNLSDIPFEDCVKYVALITNTEIELDAKTIILLIKPDPKE